MSTMLKTAAMTLLSKTLQTFLYKYLSDVDVEGVVLPSVYDGSGWGVRLSNVKLRDGVQLMEQLPGTILKKRRKRKRKPKPSTIAARNKESSNEKKETEHTRQSKSLSVDINSNTSPARRIIETTNADSNSNDNNENDMDGSIHLQDLQQNAPSEDYDEQERPDTPVQDSKSIFSCFHVSRSSHLNNNNPPPPPQPKLHDISLHGTTNSNTNSSKPEETKEELSQNSELEPVSVEEEQPVEVEVEVEEEEDEYEEYEQPLRLCLGENGRIGTLDIRLIGKELHVMVEDAVLTIEAIPMIPESSKEDQPENDEEGATADPIDAKPSSADDNDASTSTTSASNAAPPKTPGKQPTTKTTKEKKPTPKRATVGDRVLADNPLARAISAIPHLFLRDIRIRLIIRDEPPTTNTESSASASASSSTEPNPKDTMLEIGIEFLSVTSGEDVLSHFQNQQQGDEYESQYESQYESHNTTAAAADGSEDPHPHTPASHKQKPPMTTIPSFSSVDSTMDQNEYLVRHIKTGRGPSAGISLQVFAPGPKLPSHLENMNMTTTGGELATTTATTPMWARQQWVMATEFHLLRCSGLDVRARIHLGTKKEVARSHWFYGDNDDDYSEYDDYTMDSLLFGVDHIAPGPQLPLPPMSPHMSRGDTPSKQPGSAGTDRAHQAAALQEEEENNVFESHPGAEVFYKDQNGIQSCKVPSSFHRIARGMVPGSCKHCNHLPSEVCSYCWEAPDGVDKESTLDDSIPMPGLALQVTFRDPLEINVDRTSLETIGLLNSLFQKQKAVEQSDDEASSEEKTGADKNKNASAAQTATPDEASTRTHATASTSYFAGLLSSKSKEPVKEDPSDAFATYMQPENIQVMGIHLSEILFRVHVMKEDKNDGGLSFCYWEIVGSCLTMDRQSLLSPEKTFQDLELDVGRITWDEYRGTSRTQILSLGLPHSETRKRCDSAASSSMNAEEERNLTPWPSTACALLDIPAPLETLVYRDREQHGLQMRFVSVDDQVLNDVETRSLVNVRLGLASLVAPWGFWREFATISQEVVSCIFGTAKEDPPEEESNSNSVQEAGDSEGEVPTEERTPPKPKSLMKYKVQVDGGSMNIHPILDLKIPLTQFSGERSSEAGIFFETILDKLQLAYGETDPPNKKGLSLQQLAALPESVRLRILLCLEDLGSLEQALQLKKESNSFRRCRSVNKGIVKMAKKVAKAAKSSRKKNPREESSVTRRQEIMIELMKLDDNELDELWSVNQKHLKKLAKKRNTQS